MCEQVYVWVDRIPMPVAVTQIDANDRGLDTKEVSQFATVASLSLSTESFVVFDVPPQVNLLLQVMALF